MLRPGRPPPPLSLPCCACLLGSFGRSSGGALRQNFNFIDLGRRPRRRAGRARCMTDRVAQAFLSPSPARRGSFARKQAILRRSRHCPVPRGPARWRACSLPSVTTACESAGRHQGLAKRANQVGSGARGRRAEGAPGQPTCAPPGCRAAAPLLQWHTAVGQPASQPASQPTAGSIGLGPTLNLPLPAPV